MGDVAATEAQTPQGFLGTLQQGGGAALGALENFTNTQEANARNFASGGAPNITGKPYNIVQDYSWTYSPKGSPTRAEVPYIQLMEWKLARSGLLAAIQSWAYVIAQNFTEKATNPYFGLYPATQTNFSYKLPFFSEHYRSISNTWDDSEIDLSVPYLSKIPFGIGEAFTVQGVENFMKPFFTGVGHEIPQAYKGNAPESISFGFVLLNTTNVDDIKQNEEFIYNFSYQNLQNRKNAVIVDPPVFYTYEIPGVKKSNASYVSNLEITNLGQTRALDVLGTIKLIPEAYGIRITLTDLIKPSRNLMNAMKTGSDTLVIATEGAAGAGSTSSASGGVQANQPPGSQNVPFGG